MTKIVKKKNKITKVKKVKKKKEPYFGIKVQEAIVRYNDTDDVSVKNKIYGQEIHKAFDKLAENIINTFKFEYMEVPFNDIKHEVVAFIVMNMHKYDHTKGTKAFSYFSVVAKNYLILNNNANYKKLKTHDRIDVSPDISKNKFLAGLTTKEDDMRDMISHMIKYFNHKIPTMFKKKRDKDIAYAIVELLIRVDDIENFNKKALYILIREMTGVPTSNITKIMNVMRKHYRKISNEYFRSGTISLGDSKNFF
jgi:hypothetical protein